MVKTIKTASRIRIQSTAIIKIIYCLQYTKKNRSKSKGHKESINVPIPLLLH